MRIPAGVDDGQRIRLKGRGGPGRNGGPPGDLYVVVPRRAAPAVRHATARNLTLTVPVTFPEAALGADIAVPDPRRRHGHVRIPAGTRTGRTFRVKGRGVPAAKGTGDLLVTVEVAVPTKPVEQPSARRSRRSAAADGESPRDHLGVS